MQAQRRRRTRKQAALNNVANERADLSYPWESACVTEIFGERPTSPTSMFHVCPPFAEERKDYVEAEAKSAQEISHVPQAQILFMNPIDSTRNEDYPAERERRLHNVCGKWLTTVGHNYDVFAIGASILREFERSFRYEGSKKKVLSAAFGLKSPATLAKHANSMSRYSVWHKNNRSGCALPVRRSEACDLLEALRFCQHVLGLRDVDVVFQSRKSKRFG